MCTYHTQLLLLLLLVLLLEPQVSSLTSDKEEIERIAKELSVREGRLSEDKQVWP